MDLSIKLIILGIAFVGTGVIKKFYPSYQDDNIVEEMVEKVIESQTGGPVWAQTYFKMLNLAFTSLFTSSSFSATKKYPPNSHFGFVLSFEVCT